MLTKLLLSFIVAISAGAEVRAIAASSCYRYEADTVSLRGHVVRRVYPGRPNYESIKAGDEPDTVFVLQVAKPLCFRESKDFDAKGAVRELQLYFSRDDAAGVAALRGKSATLHGTFSGAVWGWHHLPVLFEIHLRRSRFADRAV